MTVLHRLSKCQSLSTTTVLFRTTFTQTMNLKLLLKWLLGSNLSQFVRILHKISATHDIRVLCSSDNGHFLFQRYIDGHCQKCQPKKSQEGPCDSMAGTGRKAVSTEIAEHFTILQLISPGKNGEIQKTGVSAPEQDLVFRSALSVKQGIHFHYLASWTEYPFLTEAFKREWRMAISGLHLVISIFPKKNLIP